MNMRDLTSGEKLLLHRRREGMTAAAAAKARKTSLYRYARWESDLEAGPSVALWRLAFYEKAFVLRRRAGMSVAELAKRFGITPWWLTQMESGQAPDGRLRDGWASHPPRKPSKGRHARHSRVPARKRRRTS